MDQRGRALQLEALLRLGDDNFILGHRISEWCGHAPTLEEDLALPNIALDLIGHAQALYGMASKLDLVSRDEDQLAFLRFEHEYKNLLLVEQDNGHFGNTVLRLFYFSTYMKMIWEKTKEAAALVDLKSFAVKAYNETVYHVRYSSEWVKRLGNGTHESNHKMLEATDNLAPFVGELFLEDSFSREAEQRKILPNVKSLLEDWKKEVFIVLDDSNLKLGDISLQKHGGRRGIHTEAFGYILSELQYLQRTFPNSKW